KMRLRVPPNAMKTPPGWACRSGEGVRDGKVGLFQPGAPVKALKAYTCPSCELRKIVRVDPWVGTGIPDGRPCEGPFICCGIHVVRNPAAGVGQVPALGLSPLIMLWSVPSWATA